MNSRFFPFEKPFYEDFLFYGFLYVIYVNLSDDLRALVDYGYGNLVFQLFEILIDAFLISWVYAILASALRLYIKNKIEKRKSNKNTVSENIYNPQVTLTKFDKPLGEMTPEERKEAFKRVADNFFQEKKSDQND